MPDLRTLLAQLGSPQPMKSHEDPRPSLGQAMSIGPAPQTNRAVDWLGDLLSLAGINATPAPDVPEQSVMERANKPYAGLGGMRPSAEDRIGQVGTPGFSREVIRGEVPGYLAGPEPAQKAMTAGEEALSKLSYPSGFYSRVDRAALKMPEAIPAQKLAKMLMDAPGGAAQEELAWRKIPELMASHGEGMVPREALLQHLAENPLAITRTRLEGNATHYADGSLSLPGGSQYRETLFHLAEPIPPDANTYTAPHFGDLGENLLAHSRTDVRPFNSGQTEFLVKNRTSGRTSQAFPTQQAAEDYQRRLPASLNTEIVTRSGSGRPGTFSQEYQSDWHQAGRKKGYEPAPQPDAPKRIPNAPFKDNWQELLMKQQLLDAAEQGHDWVGFTTGATQNDRYDLSKRISTIEYGLDAKLKAYDHDGALVLNQQVPENQLADTIGHDAATKLLSPEKYDERVAKGYADLSGLDLSTGGRGMIAQYDEKNLNKFNKLVKPLGTKFEMGGVEAGTADAFVPKPLSHWELPFGVPHVPDSDGDGIAYAILGQGDRHVASVLPPEETWWKDPANAELRVVDVYRNRAQELARQMNALHPNAAPVSPQWTAPLSAAARAKIKEGFPLLSLVAMLAPAAMASHESKK